MKKPLWPALLGTVLSLSAAGALAEDTTVFTNEIPADTEQKKTPSGLEYSVLRAGDGSVKPLLGDKVEVHYTGWTTDGKVFDSSRRKGVPAEFAVGQLIEGWNEALQMMTPGARWKLTIPPDIGYGARGSPPVIPPNATLVFDMELLSVTAMPRFRAANPEAQKTTASGLKYEVLQAGEGEPFGPKQGVDIEFALWNTKGELVTCTEQRGESIKGMAATMPFPFLTEALALMRKGSRLRCEVPAKLGLERGAGPLLPPNSTSVWELGVKGLYETNMPDFSMPTDEELTTTASGLKYQVIEEGEGESPKMGRFVTCHYAGWLTDGTLFDASFARGESARFQLGRVIAGWNEGLVLMKPGAIYKFVIPGKLAYGPRGSPPKIGPDATLVFLVQLIKNG